MSSYAETNFSGIPSNRYETSINRISQSSLCDALSRRRDAVIPLSRITFLLRKFVDVLNWRNKITVARDDKYSRASQEIDEKAASRVG